MQPAGREFDLLGLEGGKSIHGESLQMAVAVIQMRDDDSLRVNGSGNGEDLRDLWKVESMGMVTLGIEKGR